MANLKTLVKSGSDESNLSFAKVYRVGEDVLVIASGKSEIYVQNLTTNNARCYIRWYQRKGYYGKVWRRFLEYLRRTRKLTDQKIYDKAFSLSIECISASKMPKIDEEYRRWS